MTSLSTSQAASKSGTSSSAPDFLSATSGSQPGEERHAMIAEAAYFIAQSRGFTPGCEFEDWLAAERETEQRLARADH